MDAKREVRDEEAVGSNPATPTNQLPDYGARSDGQPTAIDTYAARGRIHNGERAIVLDRAYAARPDLHCNLWSIGRVRDKHMSPAPT